MSIQETAKEASAWFTRIKRNDNEEIVTLKEGRPDWVQDLVHKAHGDMMPDDFRYSIIEEAIDAIAEAEDLDEAESEYVDNIDIYTNDLTGWLHSRNDRYDYVDQARDEFGDPANTIDSLQQGQMMERREVFALVREGLEHISPEEDEEAENE